MRTEVKSKEAQKADEELFQICQKQFLLNKDDKIASAKVWMFIQDACKVSALKLLKGKGVKLSDDKLEGRILDATCEVMECYKKPGFSIDKRSSFVYWKVFAALFGNAAVREDREESLDAIEGTDDYNNENNKWFS